MRFHLVDRIYDVVEGKRLQAVKIASPLDPVVENDPVAGPCLPPMLVVECLAQASSWLVMATTDFTQRGVLGGFRRIEVGAPARIGRRLELRSEVDEWSRDGVMFTSGASEAVMFTLDASDLGQPVVQVEGALCLLVDAAMLEDPAATRHHYELLRRDEPQQDDADLGTAVVQAGSLSLDRLPPPQWSPYDILERCVPGECAVARKAVVMTDPVFGTHFPRFPVMPGVLAVQSLVELARTLLEASSDAPGRCWRPRTLQGIRYQQYVRPGDVLVLRVRILSLSPDEAEVTGQAEANGRKAFSLRKISFALAEMEDDTALEAPSPSASDLT